MPTITYNGEAFDVPEGGSYLDIAQNNGIPHDFGCTVGSCGTCRCEVLEGAENVDPVSDEEKETLEMVTDHPNGRLGCQLVVKGDISLRAID